MKYLIFFGVVVFAGAASIFDVPSEEWSNYKVSIMTINQNL
jgi:hypothetical protein